MSVLFSFVYLVAAVRYGDSDVMVFKQYLYQWLADMSEQSVRFSEKILRSAI